MLHKAVRLSTLLAWATLIAIATLLPLPDLAGAGPAWKDKAAHFLLFGGLAYFIIRYLSLFPAIKKWALVTAAVAASSAYAVFIEYAQSYIPGRSASVYDFLAGVIGALTITLMLYFNHPSPSTRLGCSPLGENIHPLKGVRSRRRRGDDMPK
jgi:VanZ family protein